MITGKKGGLKQTTEIKIIIFKSKPRGKKKGTGRFTLQPAMEAQSGSISTALFFLQTRCYVGCYVGVGG